MKVLINAINARQGGGQTYLLNLLSHMPKNMKDVHVTLLVGASFDEELLPFGIKVERVHLWVENSFLRPWWERFALPNYIDKNEVDILFCPGGVVNTKSSRCKIVTMSRNMLPFDLKQRKRYPFLSYHRFRNWLLEHIMTRSMLNSDLVVFISVYARSFIETHIGRSVNGSVVIPHGIAQQFRFNPNLALPYPPDMPPKYLLYVSNVDVYKAQLEVVQAFSLLNPKEKGLSLVLIGPEQEFYAKRVRNEIHSLDLNESVKMLGSVPYNVLPAMYQHALVNIFASECENCPNILLEMMASGQPVICSNYAPMPEFAGDGVLYFDPSSPNDLAQKLEKVMDDKVLQRNLKNLAKQKSNQYCWETTAIRTWNAVLSLVKND